VVNEYIIEIALTPLETAASTLYHVSHARHSGSILEDILWCPFLLNRLAPARSPILLLLNGGPYAPSGCKVIKQLHCRLVVICHYCGGGSNSNALKNLKYSRCCLSICREVAKNNPEVGGRHNFVPERPWLFDAMRQALKDKRCGFLEKLLLET
jgi:hypothetical protein